MRTRVVDHPLVAHKLTVLRNQDTDSPTFRNLADELVTLLAYEATTYAERLPEDLSGRQCYVLDPMLATGGTLAAAIRFLVDRGADDITAICLLAAPEGVANLEKGLEGLDVPVTVVTAALDERLNGHGYIVPGLGDAGDRLYGL